MKFERNRRRIWKIVLNWTKFICNNLIVLLFISIDLWVNLFTWKYRNNSECSKLVKNHNSSLQLKWKYEHNSKKRKLKEYQKKAIEYQLNQK